MARIASTRSTAFWVAGLVLAAGLLLPALPAAAQTITVTSAVPDITDQGTVDLVVTIGGDGFAKGAKAAFYVTGTTNPGGITVKSTKYKNPKTLEATIDVAPDAQTELKFDIQVQSGSRTGKGTELFSVKKPVLPPADPHIAFFEAYYIAVCNEDGQRATEVYSQDGCCVTHPSLSPDLRSVVFATLEGLKRVDFTVDGSDNVVVVGESLVLADADVFAPTWSPDGQLIAYDKTDGAGTSSSIGIVPADGDTAVTVYAPDPGVMVHDIAWKYTGDCLYFTEDVIGQAGSWVVKALQLDASGQPVGPPEVVFQDVRFGNDIEGLSAARTRNSVAFTSGQYLYTVDLDTLQDTFVCQAEFSYMGTLPWSPDDSQIMFASVPPRPPRKGIVLRKVTLATGETVTLISGRQPDWK